MCLTVFYWLLVSIPKIVDVSEDRTGRRALCCGKPLKLYCQAKGTPEPTYSWYFKSKRLNSAPGVVLKGGILTVRNPYVLHTNFNGEYRCVTSNAWGSVLSSPVQVKVLGESLISQPPNMDDCETGFLQ